MKPKYDDKSLTREAYLGGLQPDEQHEQHTPGERLFYARYKRPRYKTENIVTRKLGQPNWSMSKDYRQSLNRREEFYRNVMFFIDEKIVGWEYWNIVHDTWYLFTHKNDSWIINGPMRDIETYDFETVEKEPIKKKKAA